MGILKNRINEFVKEKLADYRPSEVRRPKVIHDTVLGTNSFHKHEIAVMDSPIVQRLRRISQVDVVSLVWPSGNHNRFEHSLGVAVIADKFLRALHTKEGNAETFKALGDVDELLNHVRMAGILHDCGHGPFSHMSEEIYRNYNDLKEEKEEDLKLKKADPNPHEILSYLIVTSDTFKAFFAEFIDPVYGTHFDLDFIGEMIIGYFSDPQKAFLVNIINGAFDADKLDYIQRDSHFTGIQMVLDLDRLFYTIDLIDYDNPIFDRKEKRLTVDISGLSSLEQIVFDKMMLQSTVYHHQKVRAAEGLFKSIFENVITNDIKICNRSFKNSDDFLYITDDDVYHLAKDTSIPAGVSRLAERLLQRQLPKRSLMICNRTITPETISEVTKIRNLWNVDNEIKEIRAKIAEVVKKDIPTISVEDIWFDVPKQLEFKEGMNFLVKAEGEPNGHLLLNEYFPVDQWVNAFSQNKWTAHIFTYPGYASVVNQASRKVLKESYGVEFSMFADKGCKWQ